MERITTNDLNAVLKRINQAAGFDNPSYSTPNSYGLDWAYGGVKLVQYVNNKGGERNITYGYESKRATYNLMQAYLRGMSVKVGA